MPDPVVIHSSRAAFEATAAVRAALDVARTMPYNLDAHFAVRVARAIPPRLARFRDTLSKLYGFDMAHLDDMEPLATALEYAQIVLETRAKRVRDLPELATEGYQLRTLLLTYADLLALKGHVQPEVVARIREGTGYGDLASDLNELTFLFQELPQALSAGAPVSAAEVTRANEIARAISDAMGTDKEVSLSQSELGDQRRKLAHLLVTGHREVRRAMAYLRFHEGDAQDLVPSLYQRGPGRAAKAQEPDLAAMHDELHARDAAQDHAGSHHAHPDDNPFTDGV